VPNREMFLAARRLAPEPPRIEEPRSYNIVRMYRDAGIRKRIIRERVTLAEAQAYCSDPETSSSTCTSAAGRRRTRRLGAWFDGYESR
jgi:hypothetical protein